MKDKDFSMQFNSGEYDDIIINDEFQVSAQELRTILNEVRYKKEKKTEEEFIDPYRFNNMNLLTKETNEFVAELNLEDSVIEKLIEKGIETILIEQIRKNPAGIKKVYFNEPYVIVFFDDGEKIISKASKDDIYDPKIGLAMAISTKIFGNRSQFQKFAKKWVKKEDEGKWF